MQRLILLRHAKAEGDAPSGQDFDRPLAPRGLREAEAVAAKLGRLGLRPDLALVSPAVRTRQTWDAVDAAMPGGAVRFDPSLYNAGAQELRRLASQSDEPGTVLVVAHNPGLQELAVELLVETGGPAAFLARVARAFPPAAAVVFDVDAQGRFVADGLFYPEKAA